jgi:hypothetical protein
MAAAAKHDCFILRGAERDGAILNEPEARHQHCAAFNANLALPPSESR